jgi:hypothetical protein
VTDTIVLIPIGPEYIALETEELAAARERAREVLGLADRVTTQSQEQLLTAEEIAEATPGIPPGWYLEHARQGQIPYVKLGKYIRFRLERIIEHGAVTPPVTPAGKWTRGVPEGSIPTRCKKGSPRSRVN